LGSLNLAWPQDIDPATGEVVPTQSIVVTSTRTEAELLDVPMAANVIRAKDIEKQASPNIADTLTTVPRADYIFIISISN
jgi:outer membrane cobalamin receptor